MRNHRFSFRREDGQALVELALAIPLLLFVLFAIIDFGLAINQQNDTTNLANIGARAIAVATSSSTAPTCPNGTASSNLVSYLRCTGATDNAALGSVTACAQDLTGSSWTTGDTIEIKVDSTFSWLQIITGGIGHIGGVSPSTTISSTATMREEASPGSEPSWVSGSGSTATGSTVASC